MRGVAFDESEEKDHLMSEKRDCTICGHPEVKHHPTLSETWCTVGIASSMGRGCICPGYNPNSELRVQAWLKRIVRDDVEDIVEKANFTVKERDIPIHDCRSELGSCTCGFDRGFNEAIRALRGAFRRAIRATTRIKPLGDND